MCNNKGLILVLGWIFLWAHSQATGTNDCVNLHSQDCKVCFQYTDENNTDAIFKSCEYTFCSLTIGTGNDSSCVQYKTVNLT